jgi:TP901 family phage tail tape measure protein
MGEAARIWTTVGANLAPLKAGLTEAGVATDKFGRSFGASMAAHSAQMEKFGKSWRSHISLPIAATGIVAAKMAMDFQKNMALISTSAGASAKDVQVLSKQVLDLARSGSSPYGPNELAKSLYHLKSLGYDNTTSMRTMKVAINGAMAGQSDLESTTSALGAAIRTNIKGTGDFGKAMATLNAIVGAGNMRMEDLIGALGTGILPAAKSAGLALKDVGAALALMVDEGMSSESAATRLRMAFTMMASGSDASNKALGRIGLSTKQLGMVMQGPTGLIGGLQLLHNHLDKLGGSPAIAKWAAEVNRGKMTLEEFTKLAGKTEQFDVISKAFGGAKSGAAIEMLLNNLDVLKAKMHQLNTTTNAFAEKVKEARALDVNKLKESWAQVDAALIKAGASITPVVVTMAHGLGALAGWFSKLHSGTQKWLMIAATAATAGGPLLVYAIKVANALKTVRGWFVMEAEASTVTTAVVGANMVKQEATVASTSLAMRGSMTGAWAAGSVASTATTKTILAEQAVQGAAIDSTAMKLTRFGSVMKGLAGLVIPITIAATIESMVANPGQTNKNDTWSWSGLSHGFGLFNGSTWSNLLGSKNKYAADTKMANADTKIGASAANDSPGRSNAVATSSKAQAAAVEKAMRDDLAKKGQANFQKLWNQTYGDAGYTSPNMDNIPGLDNGKKKKTSHAKAKPITNPIVAAAAEYLGVPYEWGGSSPQGFDCSGFVMYLYKKFGIDLPHYTGDQIKLGKSVALGNIKKGDVVFTEPGKGNVPGHEGLYIGNGQVESAPHKGAKVSISSLSSFLSGGLVGIRRYADFSGVERAKDGSGHYTNATSYVKIADTAKVAKDFALYKVLQREMAGLTGDTATTTTANMKRIGRALVQVFSPSDEKAVASKLAGVKKIIADAVAAMNTVVSSKKQSFATAFSRLASAGADALGKQLKTKLDAISVALNAKLASIDSSLTASMASIDAKFATGPAQQAQAALEEAHNQAQLAKGVTDARSGLATARTDLVGIRAAGVGGSFNGNTIQQSDIDAAVKAVTDAQLSLADAQYAVQDDAAQKLSQLEQDANDKSKTLAQDAAQKSADALKTAAQNDADAQSTTLNAEYDRLTQSLTDRVDAITSGMEDGSIATQTGLDQMTALFTQFGIDLGSQGPVIAGTIYKTITTGLIGAKTAADELADALRTLNLLKNTPTVSNVSVSGSSGAADGYFALNPFSTSTGTPGASGGAGKAKAFANGGIVKHRQGGILAQIGEGTEDEVVSPLSKLSQLGGGSQAPTTIVVQSVLDGKVIAESTHTELLKKQRKSSLGFKAS